ncbi:hypothetical protein HMI54_013450 [Coelomomyces lativittatus]|nr:hypothetical protein HMI54_013450 [Coelomomyces lativittatus]
MQEQKEKENWTTKMSLTTMYRFLNYDLSIEFQLLGRKASCPPGLYLFPSDLNDEVWHGIYFVPPSHLYAKAILKFTLAFPKNYPETPPLITFTTNLFHPLVHPLTHVLNYTEKLAWNPLTHGVIQVVWYIHYCFLSRTLDGLSISQCAHPECFELMNTVPEAFQEKVQSLVQSSLEKETIHGFEKGDPFVFSDLSLSQLVQVQKHMFENINKV